MNSKGKLIILLLSLFLIIGGILWNYRGIVLYYFRSSFYSQQLMVEKYFNFKLDKKTEILYYSLEIDNEQKQSSLKGADLIKIFPYNFYVELLVDENSLEKVMRFYDSDFFKNNDEQTLSSYTNYYKGASEFNGTLDYYIWYPTTMKKWYFGGNYRTQGDTYIFVSKPENGKYHIFLLKNMIGWNEVSSS